MQKKFNLHISVKYIFDSDNSTEGAREQRDTRILSKQFQAKSTLEENKVNVQTPVTQEKKGKHL